MDKSLAQSKWGNFPHLPVPCSTMAEAAYYADLSAKSQKLIEYHATISDETLRRQRFDLVAFSSYLADAGIQAGDLANDLASWEGISYGLVEGFKRWMLAQSMAVGTVNIRLATVKRYVTLAAQAGYVPHDALALIQTVKGYRPKEARNIDEKREARGDDTRIGAKKAEHTLISIEQAQTLKKQDDSRDRLLMCLLIDHGFRVGEISRLKVSNIHVETKQLTVYRHKVHQEGLQDLSKDTLAALIAYLDEYQPQTWLFPGDCRTPSLIGTYGTRAINRRVGKLGEQLGIERLSPHDLRHFWAWYAAYRGTPLNRLQQAGGWTSLEMPNRYIGKSQIENEGMVS